MADTPAKPADTAKPADKPADASKPADGKSTAAENPENKPETVEAKAERLVQGNPAEYDKALSNATPTEKAALENAKKAFDAKFAKPKGVTMAGTPGGAFAIEGSNFGSTPGTVVVNGTLVPTTRWDDTNIRGTLPANVTPGDVTINSSDGRKLTGTYGKK